MQLILADQSRYSAGFDDAKVGLVKHDALARPNQPRQQVRVPIFEQGLIAKIIGIGRHDHRSTPELALDDYRVRAARVNRFP